MENSPSSPNVKIQNRIPVLDPTLQVARSSKFDFASEGRGDARGRCCCYSDLIAVLWRHLLIMFASKITVLDIVWLPK